jgi:hypothetical protein
MKFTDVTKYISAPARTVIIAAVFLAALVIVQFIIPGLVLMLSLPEAQVASPEPQPQTEASEAEKQQQRIARATKEFLPDGTIHLITTIYEEVNGEYKTEKQIWDVNNTLLWSGTDRDDYPFEYVSWSSWSFNYSGSYVYFDAEDMESALMITPMFSQVLMVPVIPSVGQIAGYWRYEPRRRYFVGFNSRGEKIGYAGANGIREFKNQVEPFGQFKTMTAGSGQDSPSPILLWQTRHRLYKIDFLKRTVPLIFDAKEKQIAKVLSCYFWVPQSDGDELDIPNYRPAMRIVTKDRVNYLLLRDPNEQLTLKTPPNWNLDYISIAPCRDRILLRYQDQEGGAPPPNYKFHPEWTEKYRYSPYTEWVELYEVDRTGKLELINRFEWVNPGREKRASSWDKIESRRKRAARYVAALTPPIFNLAWQAHYRQVVADRNRPRGTNESAVLLLINPWRDIHLTSTPLNLALSLLMAAAAFAHGWARRTSRAKFVFWLVFVGLFNLAGLLSYLALNHTAIIRCPACGKRRGLERPDCACCGALLAVPEQRNTDVIFTA